MSNIKDVRGAIFDMDGTIVDSMCVWQKVDVDFLDKRNIKMPEDLSNDIGHMTFHDSAVYFKKRFNLDESIDEIMAEWHEMVYDQYAHHIKLKPGAGEYIKSLSEKGIKIGLATSSSRTLVDIALKNNGIFEYFDAISTVDEINKDKSFPDIYVKTAEKLGVSPMKCVVFEDIYIAVLSAKKAGMQVIGVYDKNSEYQKDDIKKNADYYIEDFYELL